MFSIIVIAFYGTLTICIFYTLLTLIMLKFQTVLHQIKRLYNEAALTIKLREISYKI